MSEENPCQTNNNSKFKKELETRVIDQVKKESRKDVYKVLSLFLLILSCTLSFVLLSKYCNNNIGHCNDNTGFYKSSYCSHEEKNCSKKTCSDTETSSSVCKHREKDFFISECLLILIFLTIIGLILSITVLITYSNREKRLYQFYLDNKEMDNDFKKHWRDNTLEKHRINRKKRN